MRIKKILLLITIFTLFGGIVHARILRIKGEDVPAYREPEAFSEVIDELHKNELYEIIGTKKGWYRLKLYGGRKGWVAENEVEVKGGKIATPEAEQTTLDLDKIYSNSIAVLIAIDEYQHGGTLGYGVNDAEFLKTELRTLGFKNIIELYNKSATYEGITNLFERELLKSVKKNDRVFVFISTKSVTREIATDLFEGYLLPYDFDKSKFDETTFSMDVLDVFLAKLEAKHVIAVYDACVSGLSLKKAVSIPQSQAGYMLAVTSQKGRQIITAGKFKNEMEVKDGRSLFIETLVEGLNGSAEQGVPDGIVTGSELGAYLKLKLSIKTQRKQTPDFGRVQGGDKGGEAIFTRRRGQIAVTQEIKQSRDTTATPEEEFLEEIATPEEVAKKDILDIEGEGAEGEEVAGPMPLFAGELVVIPAGDFQMGSVSGHINERPVHTVYLDAFYIGRYEVTNKEYSEFINATGYHPPVNVDGPESEYNFWKGRTYPEAIADKPVVNVSWYDAVAYCKWLGMVTGEKYRLPTEAEWEKAARGTDQRIYPWGNKPPNSSFANFGNNWSGFDTLYNIGYFDKGKSPYWVYEMSGNVWEWCSDWYSEDAYGKSSRSNPKGPDNGTSKVVRGGSWASSDDLIKSASRYGYYPDLRSSRGGFRIVLEPEKK